MIEFTIPGMVVVTPTNQRGRWQKGWTRTRAQRKILRVLLDAKAKRLSLPLVVTLTRVIGARGRNLDPFDNLPSAFKHLVDEIAAWLGVNDARSDLVRYVAAQERSSDGKWSVRVSIQAAAKEVA